MVSKLLVLSNMYPRIEMQHGGAFVASRIRGLRQMGVQADLVALDVLSPLHDVAEGANTVEWRGLEVAWGRTSRVASRLRPDAFRSRAVVDEVLQHATGPYDAVVAHGMFVPPAGLIGRYVANRLNVPLIIHAHGSDVNVAMARVPRLHSKLLNGADGVIFVSEPLLVRARRLGYSTGRCAVVPNGVDCQLFRPDPARKPGKRVAFVGNLEHVKGADRLPRIFGALRREEPSVELTIVGDGPLMEQIREGLALQGVHDVQILGAVPQFEVARVLRSTDVLIMPSRSEGWPCVVLEAHASGCVVVATDVGGTAEAMGTSQFVVDGRSHVEDALATKAIQALSLEGRGAGRRRIRAEGFDWAVTVARELEHIRAWSTQSGS